MTVIGGDGGIGGLGGGPGYWGGAPIKPDPMAVMGGIGAPDIGGEVGGGIVAVAIGSCPSNAVSIT